MASGGATSSAAGGPWTGTVATDFSATYTTGDQKAVLKGGITYTDLVPLPPGQTEDYSAVATGSGTKTETGYCPITGGSSTNVYPWTAAGRDPNNNGEKIAPLTIAEGTTDTLQSPSGTRYCDGAMRPPFSSGIADEEFAWASQVVQDGDPAQATTFRFQRNLAGNVDLTVREPGLNTIIRGGPGGFTPVTGAGTLFDGHGYCAPDGARYIVQLDDVNIATDGTAPMHPNLEGQAAWGQLIGAALIANLGH